MARRRRKNEGMPSFEVKKPPSDITFIPPDSLLEPYPKALKIETQYLDVARKRFREYILNGVAWANEQRQNGNPYARFPSEALCVNNLRLEVKEWRERGYPDVSDTTRFLLNFWFEYPREKVLWFSQREAVETLIYLYEVKGITKVTELIEKYGAFRVEGYDKYDKYPRYAFRMATGSGKTLVMAILSVWSFFNYLHEDRDRFTRFFLFVAPNIIVYDRLRRDLEDLAIFDEFQLIPEEWKKDFKVRVITRDTFSDADRFSPPENEGVIFVTNIHQIGFRESTRKQKEKEDLMGHLFGAPDPGKDPYKATSIKLWEILNHYPGVMILKDEAHHIHREESKWQNYLWDLHESLTKRFSKGVFMELDFSATPKDEKGALFPWIIVDFSLREALQTGIVKYPAKVVLHEAPPIKKGFSIEEFRPYIDAALDRWRKHREKLKELGNKPVLFIMADEIENAEAIYEELLKEPDISAENMILVHSELDEWKAHMKAGGRDIVSKIRIDGEEKELDRDLALKLVRGLDEPGNPIEVISSVMMLNEGWDVRSVTVILGLRSYASEREILPEQVIGRGLRKLFPEEGVSTEKWVNVLEVVGPPRLLEVLDQLEAMEGIKLPEAPEKFFISFNPRLDAPERMRFGIPNIEFLSFVKTVDLNQILRDLFDSLPQRVFRRSEVEEFQKTYRYDVIAFGGRTLDRGEITSPLGIPIIPLFRLAEELEEVIPLPHSLGSILEMLEEYVRERLFDEPVDVDEEVLKFLYSKGWYIQVKQELMKRAMPILSNPSFSSKVEIARAVPLEDLEGFPWYKEFSDSEKSLLVRVTHNGDEERRIPSCPVDNEMEADFVRFLDRARDVISFIKNVPHVVKLWMRYYDTSKRKWRKFYPDFIVKAENGIYLVETKGREEIQVPDKNAAAQRWCEAVSEATGERWYYLYLREGEWMGKEGLKDCGH